MTMGIVLLGVLGLGPALAGPAVARPDPAPPTRAADEVAAAVDDLLSVLDPHASPDDALRGLDGPTVIKRLRALGPGAVDPLVAVLRDVEDPRRPLAGQLLGRLGGRASTAVPQLLDATDDDRQAAPLWSARAVAAIGPRALPAVREQLDVDPGSLRGHARRGRTAVALGALGFLPEGSLPAEDVERLRRIIVAGRSQPLGGLDGVAQAALIHHRAMQPSDLQGDDTPQMRDLLDGWLNDLSEGMPAEANLAALSLAILCPPEDMLRPVLEPMWARESLEPERIACVAELVCCYPPAEAVMTDVLAASLVHGLSDDRAAAAARVLMQPGRADAALDAVFEAYAHDRLGEEVMGSRWRAPHRVLAAAGRRAGPVADGLVDLVEQRRAGELPHSVVPEFELLVSIGGRARPALGQLMESDDELVASLARHAAQMIADPDGHHASLLEMSLAGARKALEQPRRR